jgi:hypothetical protein
MRCQSQSEWSPSDRSLINPLLYILSDDPSCAPKLGCVWGNAQLHCHHSKR